MSKASPSSKRSPTRAESPKRPPPGDKNEDSGGSEAIGAEKFLENVALLDGETKLAITYDRLIRRNRFTFEAFMANWPDVSKYRKCAPLPDDRRVILPPLRPCGPDYVQAQSVLFNVRPYILAQAPLRSTAGDFWRMVYHEEPIAIVVILHTSEISENGGTKSVDFWPTVVKDSKTFNGSGIVVTLDAKNEDKSGTVVKYDLNLSVSEMLYSKQKFEDVSEKSNEKMYRLFHYNAWQEETQPPDVTDLAKFLKGRVLNALGRPKENELMSPLLVVSLNGLNRAPAVCGLMEVAWNFEQRGNRFDLMWLTDELAKQCPGALSDCPTFMAFYATAFKIAALYSAGEKVEEMEAVVRELTKPLSEETMKKIWRSDGSVAETDENDSMDEEVKEGEEQK